ncbi:MAG: DUF459 domain-containing protein [Alphaproteobacteria bacterium]|nr:MAG: DUF459 domain-containing protein [Alphaproteobacteria bacterium]
MALPSVCRAYVAAAAAGITLALLLPAQAQFWDWGNRPQRQQQYNNNWGGWGGGWNDRRYYDPYRQQEREAPVDYSRAPSPAQKKPEATTSIVVMGDGNADWLAYGLEDTFAEKPEIAVVRKHRTDSGLIRYDQRREVEWPQVAREIIAAEKPKFIVMMIGNNDRQTIREKAPPAPRPGAPKPNVQATTPAAPAAATPTPAPPPDPEQQPEPADAEHANLPPEQARQASYGPWEFHTEKWELAYIRRIDATIAALKSAGVPVMWVGLPSQRNTKASADSSYLNELYRSRAEKAGIVYVDIWDGFVDEAGRYNAQGPDYEGQIRRLRSGDGVYFTKFGARKLAHYVDREIQRSIANRGMPVALPLPADSSPQGPNAKPGGPAQRPAAGPVVPLTAMQAGPEELIGGGRAGGSAGDATASRVLSKGDPAAAPSGRADDFSWPRGSARKAPPADSDAAALAVPEPTPDDAAAKSAQPPSGQRASTAESGSANAASEEKPPVKRRPRRPNPDAQRQPFAFPNFFR